MDFNIISPVLTIPPFVPPARQSLFSRQSFEFLKDNVLTLGIFGVVINVDHREKIQQEERKKELLTKKIVAFQNVWKTMSERLSALFDEVLGFLSETDPIQELDFLEDLEERVGELLKKKNELEDAIESDFRKKPKEAWHSLVRTSAVILDASCQFIFNVSTVGFSTCYQHGFLEYQMKLLIQENCYVEQKLAAYKDGYNTLFEKHIDLLKVAVKNKSDLLGIAETDPAIAYFEASESKKECGSLNRRLKKEQDEKESLQEGLDKLTTQYEESESQLINQVNYLRQLFAIVSRDNQQMQLQIAQLTTEKSGLVVSHQQQMEQMKEQLRDLEQPGQGIEDLQKRIGPIPAKYKPQEEEFEKAKEANQEEAVFISSYTQRYQGLNASSEVFKSGFSYSLSEIFSMADKEDGKVLLNRSLGTPTSQGAQVVYRWLVLDWIKGGVMVSTCHGHELHLNDEGVKLIPSLSENVLTYQEVDGKRQPLITVCFRASDDFTPPASVLQNTSAACGIDPIAAKCLWAGLSTNERIHLLNLLLEPARENDCPDALAALDFIGKLPKKRKENLLILRDLISDMAVAVEEKFRQNLAMLEWRKYLKDDDLSLEPFSKKDQEALERPSDADESDDKQLVPWSIPLKFFSDNFASIILNAQQVYLTYFGNLKRELLLHSMNPGQTIKSVTWDHLSKQCYKSHLLISFHGCLFSNLLAVLMVNMEEVQKRNIVELKTAMAAYLDHPAHAEEFAGALKNDFQCTVKQFKEWLRDERGAPNINTNHLTPVVIEIAAYTLGIRIALFSPPYSGSDYLVYTQGIVDAFGRLMPAEGIMGHYFGPPTEEVLCMAVENGMTYYGLFPKLKVTANHSKLGISSRDFQVIQRLDAHWQQLVKASY